MKTSHRSARALCLVLAVAAITPASAAPFFTGLGDLPDGDFRSVANAVSGDGSTVVGYGSNAQGKEAFRWTPSTGMVGLGYLPGGANYSEGRGVSSNGAVVVGLSLGLEGMLERQAFRWTSGGGMVGLGDLPGGNFRSDARGVSADGAVVAGYGTDATGFPQTFRWTADVGMVGLGDLPGQNSSTMGNGVSGNGTTIFGEARIYFGPSRVDGVTKAIRWTANTGMVEIGELPDGGVFSTALGASNDGSVIVGVSSGAAGNEAFRWSQSTGMIGLGDIPGGNFESGARATSGDGAVVVGQSLGPGGYVAFIWNEARGMRDLAQVLISEHGLDLAGWRLTSANGISADGLVIAGEGVNPQEKPEAWVASLRRDIAVPEPDGLMILAAGLCALALLQGQKRREQRMRAREIAGRRRHST